MKETRFSIDGRDYPCFVTLGAFLEFRQQTGREAQEALKDGDITVMTAWLWACVRSASRRGGSPMELSLQEFADRLKLEDLQRWIASVSGNGEDGDTGESKKKRESPES